MDRVNDTHVFFLCRSMRIFGTLAVFFVHRIRFLKHAPLPLSHEKTHNTPFCFAQSATETGPLSIYVYSPVPIATLFQNPLGEKVLGPPKNSLIFSCWFDGIHVRNSNSVSSYWRRLVAGV